MWIDPDALVTNPARRLEELVDENVDFLVPEDFPPRLINSGVFLLRNCPAALDMLRRAYAKVQYMHHPAQERPALFDALRECADVLRTRIVSRKLLASFADEHEQGDFIVHFAGGSIEAKLAGVKKAIASAAKSSRRSFAPRPLSAPPPVHDLLPPNPPASRKFDAGASFDRFAAYLLHYLPADARAYQAGEGTLQCAPTGRSIFSGNPRQDLRSLRGL